MTWIRVGTASAKIHVFGRVNSLVHDTCTNSKGEFNISVSGGVPPYEYSIDNGSSWVSTSNFSGLSFGSYDVLVRDNASCSTNVQVVDILNYPDPVITNVSSEFSNN